jgi:RNA polymerase sigma-70 factor (ECF subfamily)
MEHRRSRAPRQSLKSAGSVASDGAVRGPLDSDRGEKDPDGSLLTKALPSATQSNVGELSEVEAIRLAQQGDEQSFERIYRLHSQRVYTLCLRMVRGNATEAEELTQESFLQLFRKISTFRGGFQVLSLDEMLEPGDKTAGPLQKRIASRDLRLAGSVDRMDLERALEQLPPGYKAVFILHEVQGYQHREIAAMRGVHTGQF